MSKTVLGVFERCKGIESEERTYVVIMKSEEWWTASQIIVMAKPERQLTLR
jgi:hypothetical protein